MNPVIIALICAAGFGLVVALSSFIRQLILSRDKKLNDEAQRRALTQEAAELEKLRDEMHNNRRFDTHYKVLGANKDSIIYLDTEINKLIDRKKELVTRYGKIFIKESNAVINGKKSNARKKSQEKLKAQMDAEITLLNDEIASLQQRRASLWTAHNDFQDRLLKQENSRNENLDAVYKQHSGVLERIYLRHTDDSENVAKETIAAGTSSFKSMILAPLQFMLQYFGLSSGIALAQAQAEQAARDQVGAIEGGINQVPAEPVLAIPVCNQSEILSLRVTN